MPPDSHLDAAGTLTAPPQDATAAAFASTDLDIAAAAGAAPSEGDAALLFGAEEGRQPPLWLWLSVEPEEVAALERALLGHLRSPRFPARFGDTLKGPDDDAGLIDFARRFAPIAPRFAHGPELVLAALRVVAERGAEPWCRIAALGCIEQLQLRLHGAARALGGAAPGDGGAGERRLRHFVLAARLAADLWVRFVPGADSGQPIGDRLVQAGRRSPPCRAGPS